MRRRLSSAALLALIVALPGARVFAAPSALHAADGSVVSATTPPGDASCASPWTSVVLVAQKGPLRAHVSVKVELFAGATAVAGMRSLAACPEVDARVSESTCLVRLESITDAPFSAPRRSVAWLDLAHGGLQVESWQGKTHHLHRECAGGRQSTRWRVKGDAEELVRTRTRVAPPPAAGLPIVDGTSLAWFASVQRLDREGAHLDVAAWSGGVLVPIRLDARESVTLARRDQPSVQARRVSVMVREDAEDADGAVAPFGLTGEVSLWLEQGSGRVLAIEGRSAKIGHVRAVNREAGIR